MEYRLAVVRDYADLVEAETIRIRLAAAGIPAFVTGTDAATSLGMGGAPTWRMVRVEVPRDDYVRAKSLLEEDQRRILEDGPWLCSRCREQNEAAFEVCWSCAKPRGTEDLRGRFDDDRRHHPSAGFDGIRADPLPGPSPGDHNPYRPVILKDATGPSLSDRFREDVSPEETAESVLRAFRAAIVGIMLFPPLLNLYSIYLLIQLHPGAHRDPGLRIRIIIAWCMNLVTIPGWACWWYTMFFT